MNDDLLTLHLAACVPLEIEALTRQGGATDYHIEEAQRRFETLREPEMSEALYFPIRNKTGRTMSTLVECMAVLAFVPGGVTAFGCHFEEKSA